MAVIPLALALALAAGSASAAGLSWVGPDGATRRHLEDGALLICYPSGVFPGPCIDYPDHGRKGDKVTWLEPARPALPPVMAAAPPACPYAWQEALYGGAWCRPPVSHTPPHEPPEPPHGPPARVPLPAPAFLLLAGLAMLRSMRFL